MEKSYCGGGLTEVEDERMLEVEDGRKLEAKGERMPGVEVDAWRGELGTATFRTSVPGPEEIGCGKVFSTSLSYTELSVVAKSCASPDAIFRTWSISNFGSFPVKLL